MKYLKAFENHSKGWIIPIDEKNLNVSIFRDIPDIRDTAKEGDIVIGVWFSGSFDVYLLKLESGDDLGCEYNDAWYGIDYAWGVFNPKDYNKYVETPIETIVTANKYNL